MRAERGWSMPCLNILVVVIAALTWFYGWIVLAITAALFVGITISVALYDWLSHDKNCRWCNHIKTLLDLERGIARDRIKTKHIKGFPTHFYVRVFVDGEPDVVVDVDYNADIQGVYLGGNSV